VQAAILGLFGSKRTTDGDENEAQLTSLHLQGINDAGISKDNIFRRRDITTPNITADTMKTPTMQQCKPQCFSNPFLQLLLLTWASSLTMLNAFAPLSTTRTHTSHSLPRQQHQHLEYDQRYPIRQLPQGANRQLHLFAVAKTGGQVLKTNQEFEDVVLKTDSATPVLVFFTAPWCGPCRLTAPVVKDVRQQFSTQSTGLNVVEVCTDDLPDVAAEAGVVSIPTIQLYAQGQLMDTIVGCVATSVLANCVQKTLEEVEAMQPAKKATKPSSGDQ
jgi:thioredoxin 1